MNHHPLRRVKNKRVCKLNAFQRPAKLWTEVGGASIRSIHVQPEGLLFTCAKAGLGTTVLNENIYIFGNKVWIRTDWTEFRELVEGTNSCCS